MKKNHDYVWIVSDMLKLLRIMKLTVFLLTLMFVQTFASSYAQTTEFNFTMEDVTIKEVIEHLEQESEFYFFLKQDQEILNKKVDVVFEDNSIEQVLDKLLEDTSFSYKIVDKYIAIKPLEDLDSDIIPLQEKKEIKGKVTDEEGLALPGVSVIVKGTIVGTTTDVEGNYILKLPSNAEILVFSFVGMKAKEVIVNGSTEINVVLSTDLTNLEEIQVKGYRLSNIRAIVDKKKDMRVLDAIAADDIGSLPDDNAGDALKRIPGVAIKTDQAEARFVSVRGLNANLNFTTFNGNIIASPDRNGRQIFLDVLPSTLSKSIEVIKTFTPDIDGGGIGAHVNFVPRSAFDYQKDSFLKVYGRIGQWENNKGYNGSSPSGRVDIVWAKKINNKFGFVIASDYYLRDSYIERLETGNGYNFYDANLNKLNFDWTSNGRELIDVDGSPISTDDPNVFGVPSRNVRYKYHNRRQRYGTSLKFDFKPNKSLDLFLLGFYHISKDKEARQANQAESTQTILSIESKTSGTIRMKENMIRLGQFDFTRNVWGVQTGFHKELNNLAKLSGSVTYSGTYFSNPETFLDFRQNNLEYRYDISYKGTDREQIWTPLNQEDYSNLNNYTLVSQGFRLDDRTLNEDVFEAKIDYGNNADGVENGWGYKIGAKFRVRDRRFTQSRDRYKATTVDPASQYYLSAQMFNGGLERGVPGGGNFYNAQISEWNKFFAQNKDNSNYFTFNPEVNSDNSANYGANEKVVATYGMLTHKGHKHSLIAGLRYEKTSFTTNGRKRIDGGNWEDASNKGDYSNFLPSVNFSYFINDNFKLHIAYSRSLGRPGFADYAARNESYTEQTDGTILGNRGNPDLKARVSDNFDLSLEYYFDNNSGIVSAGVFHKNIKNEFFRITEYSQIDWNGQQRDAELTQMVNLNKPVKVSGLELNFVKDLTFLPEPFDGLGVSLNATWLKTDWKVPNVASGANDVNGDGLLDIQPYRSPRTLIDQAEDVYNASLYYEQGRWSSRLAYHRTGWFLDGRLRKPEETRFQLPRDIIDFQLAFDILDNLKLSFEALNITNSTRSINVGLDQELVQTAHDHIGRAYFFGVTYTL